MKLLFFATHPIQYQTPIYKELAKKYDLTVVYLLKQTKKGQAEAGFGVEFEWDVPLLEGYNYTYLKNYAVNPSSSQREGIILKTNELDSLITKENPDIVFINGWFPKGVMQVVDYCNKKKITTVCRGDSNLHMVSNPIKKIIKEIYMRTVLRKIDYFLYVGNENKKFYKHYGIKDERLFPAFHCINTPFFKEQFEHTPRKKFNKDKIEIGFVGKFIAIKNPFLLIQGISKSRYSDKITLNMIGDGQLKNEILGFAQEQKVNINMLGFLNQSELVAKGFKNFDFLALTSKSETWGLVINEVMTGGIPAITSSTVGCNTDLIENGVTGFTFENNNVASLSERIDDLIDLLALNSETINNNVLAKIELYSLENTVRSYQSLIAHIAE